MILENGDRLFKSLNQYRFLGVDDLPRTVNMYSYSIDIFSLDNKTGEITLNACPVSLKEIIENYLNIGSGALLIIICYIFRLIGEMSVFTYLIIIASIMKEIFSQNGNAILMKFETLDDLQDYIKLIYHNSQHHKTLCFQMQFISIRCSNNIRENIKSE